MPKLSEAVEIPSNQMVIGVRMDTSACISDSSFLKVQIHSYSFSSLICFFKPLLLLPLNVNGDCIFWLKDLSDLK